MIRLTAEQHRAIEERCYYARWGYDGLGSEGPMISFEEYEREERAKLMAALYAPKKDPHNRSFEASRHHRKGLGWKKLHES